MSGRLPEQDRATELAASVGAVASRRGYALRHGEITAFYAAAYADGLKAAAEVARATVCDTHIPTGIKIYGSRAADAILALIEKKS